MPEQLPPSARFVHKVILYEGPVVRAEISEKTGYSQATVNRALKSLRQHGLVKRTLDPQDARKRRYSAEVSGADAPTTADD